MAAPGKAATRIRTLILFAAVLAPLAVARGQVGTLVGRVTDRGSGQPIEAVRVQVSPTAAAATDARGNYVIRNAPVGPQTVRTVRIGFRPETKAVTVVAGDSVRADFTIIQSAVELDQIVADYLVDEF